MEPRHTTVAIPIELMDRVKEYREDNRMGYSTNSEVVRQAIREFIIKDHNGGSGGNGGNNTSHLSTKKQVENNKNERNYENADK
jgi:metal-responsive CopG/Arc/MetJ family transcriptional regulator